MHIGIDIDGTLADLSAAVVEKYNTIAQPTRPLHIDSWTSWDFYKEVGWTEEQMVYLMDLSWADWRAMPLLEEGLGTTITRLRDAGHRIHIISNRTRRTHLAVLQWLESHNLYYDVLTLQSPADRNKSSKLDFPIDVLIDDHPKLYVESEYFPQKRVYLLTRLWNKDSVTHHPNHPHPNVLRVATVKEAVDDLLL